MPSWWKSYRRGGVDRIEAELKKWDDRRVGEVIVLLARLRNSNPVVLDTRIARPDVGGWSMPLIGAAVLLHLSAMVTSILAEMKARYVLTYYRAGVRREGWHRIEVRVKGRRAQVRARRGYYGS